MKLYLFLLVLADSSGHPCVFRGHLPGVSLQLGGLGTCRLQWGGLLLFLDKER